MKAKKRKTRIIITSKYVGFENIELNKLPFIPSRYEHFYLSSEDYPKQYEILEKASKASGYVLHVGYVAWYIFNDFLKIEIYLTCEKPK